MSAPFGLSDDSVVVVVGSGAGGGTLANQLAQKGVDVVCLEAGGRFEPEDHIDDEWPAFQQLAWLDPRIASGTWRLTQDFPNLPAWHSKCVGGSPVHWAGCCPRFQEHEFKARTTYGEIPGATLLDWPIDLAELEPYYARAEDNIGVAGTGNRPHHAPNNNAKVMLEGARRMGYTKASTGHYGHNSVPYDGRPATIQDGFCFEGNKSRAKWSPLVSDLPKGERTGHLEVRPLSMALRIEHDDAGKVTGVVYADADGAEQRQAARVVCVAGNSIESPRLLFNSASALHPDGLGNASGQLGRNYMRHMSDTCWAIFDKPVHFYRGNTMAGIVEDEAGNDPERRGFVGGFYMETIHLGPAFMASFMNPHAWGREFTELMDAYDNFAGMWLVGEDMPSATNRVTLKSDQTDQYGLPIPEVHFDDHKNDIDMRQYADVKAREL
ncbi:MAG TPA: GMC family oxidoreductase, partial [Propionibacteriaceae bacterium]|nr:GMC family oxidoreductase [Propionibacteriaceae bacterium]